MIKNIYLDHAATTFVKKEVLDEISLIMLRAPPGERL